MSLYLDFMEKLQTTRAHIRSYWRAIAQMAEVYFSVSLLTRLKFGHWGLRPQLVGYAIDWLGEKHYSRFSPEWVDWSQEITRTHSFGETWRFRRILVDIYNYEKDDRPDAPAYLFTVLDQSFIDHDDIGILWVGSRSDTQNSVEIIYLEYSE